VTPTAHHHPVQWFAWRPDPHGHLVANLYAPADEQVVGRGASREEAEDDYRRAAREMEAASRAAWVADRAAAGWPSWHEALYALVTLCVPWARQDAPPPEPHVALRTWYESSRWIGSAEGPDDVDCRAARFVAGGAS
jgi:hypothetical protein